MNRKDKRYHDPVKCPACSLNVEHSKRQHDCYLSVWCEEHQFWCDQHEPIFLEDTISEQFSRVKTSLDNLRRSQLKLFTTKVLD